jgi:hypothetical protein
MSTMVHDQYGKLRWYGKKLSNETDNSAVARALLELQQYCIANYLLWNGGEYVGADRKSEPHIIRVEGRAIRPWQDLQRGSVRWL